jgi:multidrug efflux pump subunit AcrB
MLAELAVKRWQLTLVAFIAVIALGANALLSIPKAEDPTFPIARFGITAVLPGASPGELERQVVDPIESKLNGLSDVKALKTTISDSLALLDLEFVAGSDPDRKHDAVLRELAALRASLPPELMRIEVRQFTAAGVNVLEVALVSESASYRELDRMARALKRRMESVPGVDEASIAGLPGQEVRVAIDAERMVALGIAPQEVLTAIGDESVSIPAGSVDQGARRFNVRTSGDYGSIEEVRRTVVRTRGDSSILLRDLARVSLHDQEASELARFNGKRAVLVLANLRENQNIFSATTNVERELTAFAATLPAHVKLERGFQQAHNVSHRLHNFTRDFALAILLVLAAVAPGPARRAGGDGVDPAEPGSRAGDAAAHRLHLQPAERGRLRDRARSVGR